MTNPRTARFTKLLDRMELPPFGASGGPQSSIAPKLLNRMKECNAQKECSADAFVSRLRRQRGQSASRPNLASAPSRFKLIWLGSDWPKRGVKGREGQFCSLNRFAVEPNAHGPKGLVDVGSLESFDSHVRAARLQANHIADVCLTHSTPLFLVVGRGSQELVFAALIPGEFFRFRRQNCSLGRTSGIGKFSYRDSRAPSWLAPNRRV